MSPTMNRRSFFRSKKREYSVFSIILSALILVLLTEAVFLTLAFLRSKISDQLRQNALDILDKQVENRCGYIDSQFSEIRHLTDITTEINNATQELIDNGTIDLATIDASSENSLPLFKAILPELITALRNRPATGIFVILNTHDLDQRDVGTPLPCVYLRDLDPEASSSALNSDLLLERASSQLLQSYSLSTDKGWAPTIQYKGLNKKGFFQLPFQTAYEADSKLNASDYGRLCAVPYTLTGDDRSAIAYSQPLILSDGTVYGVIGIELLTSYLETKMPSNELQNDGEGFYMLASTTDDLKGDELTLTCSVSSGSTLDTQELTLHRDGSSWYFDLDGKRNYAALRQITMYRRNAPFSEEQWLLVGAVESSVLFSFSNSVNHLLLSSILLMLAVGLSGSFVVSRALAKPISLLSLELASSQSQNNERIPQFSRTGIQELDQFAAAITQLAQENLAAATLERIRIEHERDYDILTGLYNRQAFHRVCEGLFAEPEHLKHAALVMMDMDNLKQVNDRYGHDLGDQYLHQTGQCLIQNTPAGTLCSRLSGDEFLLLFYGYDSQDSIRKALDELHLTLNKSISSLPTGRNLHISISGGIAWYPENSTNYLTLKKYADFAMYQVKQSEKGRLCEFDPELYKQHTYELQTNAEFETLLQNESVTYFFQPIFETQHGTAIACEALMRVLDLPTLSSPATVMRLATETGRLYDIERITLFKGSEAFELLQQNGLIPKDTLLFINSIANVSLSDDDWARYIQTFPTLPRQIVVEITEEEQVDHEALERKRSVPGSLGIFAIDDYGNGYSNGSNLLTIQPRYIKVDISIIRNIDTDPDKQRFLTSTIEYAHPHGIQVLAEGVETLAELRTVLELGVDLLQGYCLARPAAIPLSISPDALSAIREYRSQKTEI